ncbi:MAG: hypothetical protein HUU28_00740 [Planctomycetaceae bacterium]|nr:hypothetical protein [Planctomycetaceae bacterium]
MRSFPRRLGWWFVALVFAVMAIDRVLVRWPTDDSNAHPVIAIQETPSDLAARSAAPPSRETERGADTDDVDQADAERVPVSPDARGARTARPGTGERWSGRVTFVGPEPARDSFDLWTIAEGELLLDFEGVGGVRLRRASTIKDGAWSFELPFVAEDIVEVKVAGVLRRERLWSPRAGFERLPLELGTIPEIEVEAAPVTTLRVVDAGSGAPIQPFHCTFDDELSSSPLASVEQGWGGICEEETLELHPRRWWFLQPGPKLVAIVRAEGHVASSVEFSLGSGETHVVRLRLAGSAKLSWSLPERHDLSEEEFFADSIELVVETRDAQGVATSDELVRTARYSRFEFDTNDGTPASLGRRPEPVVVVEGLAPGSYRATVTERSIWSSEGSPVAQASFRVRAGHRTEVVLRDSTAAGEPQSPLQLAIELSDDSASPRGERVRIQRRTTEGWSQGRTLALFSTWKTEAFPVPYGSFRASVTGLREFTLEFEHSATSEQPVRLRAPPFQRLEVHLRLDSGDTAARRERLHWRPIGESQTDGMVERVANQPGTFELFTQSLPIEIAIEDDSRYELAGGPWLRLAAPGLHEVVAVDKARFRLRFLDDGKPVRIPIGMSISVHAEPDFGLAVSAPRKRVAVGSSFPNELHVWFTRFGEQRITFGELPGFEPIPDLAVDVKRGDDRVVELTLVRGR